MSQSLIVAKFGGTSVADYDAMNRSADVVLSDANTRLVVLSASAGVTNLLVSLAEGRNSSSALICWIKSAPFNTPSSIACSRRTSSVRRLIACWRTSSCWRKRRH